MKLLVPLGALPNQTLGFSPLADPERPRFLSEADCHDLMQRLSRFATGGGYTHVAIMSAWTASVRWARNQIHTVSEVQDNRIDVTRHLRGAIGAAELNDTSDAALVAATRRAEQLVAMDHERLNSELRTFLPLEPITTPSLFSEGTVRLSAEQRSAAALALIHNAQQAGMLSAGYIEVAAVSMAVLDSDGRVRYFPYTQARYSVTVRDSKAGGSGWAGVDWYDWQKIDASTLNTRAVEKCVQSRNPVTIEPGRYTTILEPQAVSDFVGGLIRGDALRRTGEEDQGRRGPFFKSGPTPEMPVPMSKLGEKVVDARITISADPMDPDLGFPPFEASWSQTGYQDPFVFPVFHPVRWIENGVLVNLAYDRIEGIARLGKNLGLPNSGAFRMSGGATTVEEMIATTKRGLLVTRFDQIIQRDFSSQLYRGYTRDGLWLIENGMISKPVKNMVFTESILFALNNIEQIGSPQRVFNPTVAPLLRNPQPAVVPPLKIKDFSFTALADAI